MTFVAGTLVATPFGSIAIEHLVVPRSHPFFTGEWLAAGALVPGACVHRRDGSWHQIHGVRDGGRARVYELTLAELHIYYVGATELSVRDVQRAPAVRHAALHHRGL
jgi:hypothetical protein